MTEVTKAIKKELAQERKRLRSELPLLRQRGFMFTKSGARARNPVYFLEDDQCLVAVAGGLFSLCTTSVHFGPKMPYLVPWKSSDGNKANATLSSTQLRLNEEGDLIPYTLIYYRYISSEMLKHVAEWQNKPVPAIDIDHINNKRGDNRICNLRPADPEQNNMNKNPDGTTPAFFTWDEVETNLATGTWKKKDMGKDTLKALENGESI